MFLNSLYLRESKICVLAELLKALEGGRHRYGTANRWGAVPRQGGEEFFVIFKEEDGVVGSDRKEALLNDLWLLKNERQFNS